MVSFTHRLWSLPLNVCFYRPSTAKLSPLGPGWRSHQSQCQLWPPLIVRHQYLKSGKQAFIQIQPTLTISGTATYSLISNPPPPKKKTIICAVYQFFTLLLHSIEIFIFFLFLFFNFSLKFRLWISLINNLMVHLVPC